MSQPDGCPHDLYVLMRRCWEKETELRPDFGTLRRLLDAMMESQSGDYFKLQGNLTTLHPLKRIPLTPQIQQETHYSSLAPPTKEGSEVRNDSACPESPSCLDNVLYTCVDTSIESEVLNENYPSTSFFDLRNPSASFFDPRNPSTSLFDLRIPGYKDELNVTLNEKPIPCDRFSSKRGNRKRKRNQINNHPTVFV